MFWSNWKMKALFWRRLLLSLWVCLRVRYWVLLKAKELEYLEYEPLFNPHDYDVERRRSKIAAKPDKEDTRALFEIQEPQKNLTYRVITTDFVSLEEGTGIVHIAPAFGELDFEAGRKHNLDFVQPVDLEWQNDWHVSFSGKFVKDADPLILDDLKSRGLIYRSEKIHHTYPFCWRCEAPLLYYAKKTWYIQNNCQKTRTDRR